MGLATSPEPATQATTRIYEGRRSYECDSAMRQVDVRGSLWPRQRMERANEQLELSALLSIAVCRRLGSSSLMLPSTRDRAAAQLQSR